MRKPNNRKTKCSAFTRDYKVKTKFIAVLYKLKGVVNLLIWSISKPLFHLMTKNIKCTLLASFWNILFRIKPKPSADNIAKTPFSLYELRSSQSPEVTTGWCDEMSQVILGLWCREAITRHKKVMMDYVLTYLLVQVHGRVKERVTLQTLECWPGSSLIIIYSQKLWMLENVLGNLPDAICSSQSNWWVLAATQTRQFLCNPSGRNGVCSRCGHELCWDVRELRKEVLQNCSIRQIGRRLISSI